MHGQIPANMREPLRALLHRDPSVLLLCLRETIVEHTTIIKYGIPTSVRGITAMIGASMMSVKATRRVMGYGKQSNNCVTLLTISHTNPVSPLKL